MRFDIKSISAFDRAFPFALGFCIGVPILSGPVALVIGITLALATRGSLSPKLKPWISQLLGLAVTLLGAGIPLREVLQNGGRGLGLSLALIVLTLLLGKVLARRLQVEASVGTLISSGTAICGGSAIAAVSAAIRAPSESTAISLAIVFILNSLAVWIFPAVGQLLQLSGEEFGTWAALAIHDTSSVVAAAVAYGMGSEAIAVPMKLARALWILPIAWALGQTASSASSGGARAKLPWFIPSFIVVAAFFSFFTEWSAAASLVVSAGKKLLVIVLFLIGTTLSRDALKRTGKKPFLLGISLWVAVSVASLLAIRFWNGS